MKRSALLAVAAIFLATSAVAAATMTVQQEMKALVEPASNTVFALGGDVDPANGPDAAKVPEARWQQGMLAAEALQTVAADLNGSQRKPGSEWDAAAKDFARLAADAQKAALKKDGAAFSTAANALADTCTACHTKYKPKS